MTSRKSFRATFMAPPKVSFVRRSLWQDLDKLLAEFGDRPLRVLDAGGGEGQTAILMAQRGHHVTLCDLSAEMVARAGRAAEEKGVSDNMHFIHCAAQDIPQHLETQVDLILFHAVLEWIAEPQAMLKRCGRCCARAVRYR